jgi:hypothetical protein
MSTYQGSSPGALAGGPVAAIGGIILLVNVVGLFAFTGLALAIFAYIGITLLLIGRAGLYDSKSAAAGAGSAAMIFSWLAALGAGVLVGALHWVSFLHVAYVTLGLYALAVAIWLLGRALSFAYACLFTSLGAALLAAVICLPAPPGSEDPDDKQNRTRLLARFVDETGAPVEEVEAWFDLKWFWCDDPRPREKADATSLRPDNSYGLPAGSTPWEFSDDPRFKLVVIRARRRPHYDGRDAGYADIRRELPIPRRGEQYPVVIELKEQPHPNVAFLDVTDAGSDEKDRFIELRLSQEPEMAHKDSSASYSADNVSAKACAQASVSRYSGFRGVLRVGPELADRPLFLHANPSWRGWKLAEQITPLRLGERRRVTLHVR